MTSKPTTRERFDALWTPEPNTGCWLWLGAATGYKWGYGCFSAREFATKSAHRIAWMIYRGPIPNGLMIDHMCRVPCCVNPDHLRVVNNQQNT